MKFLHTMLRVKDLEESIKFYVDTMGFELVRKTEYPHGKFTLAFLLRKKMTNLSLSLHTIGVLKSMSKVTILAT